MGFRRVAGCCSLVLAVSLMVGLVVSPSGVLPGAAAEDGSGFVSPATVPSPGEVGLAGSVAGLDAPDPLAEVDVVAPPSPDGSGAAKLSYPLELPRVRELSQAATPQLALTYQSGGGSGWVGQGWSFGAGQVSVDTGFGVPRFCPRPGPGSGSGSGRGPGCGDVESESYRLERDYDHHSGNLTAERRWDNDRLAYDTPVTYTEVGQHRLADGPAQTRLEHDANGNITLIEDLTTNTARTLTWNSHNQLTAISAGGPDQPAKKYAYDYAGYLATDGTTQFLNPWVRYEGTKLVKSYLAEGQRIAHRDTTGRVYYLLRNLQRSTNAVINPKGGVEARTEYLPYGQTWIHETPTWTTWRSPYGFSSELNDTNTGAIYYGQRWYHPGLGQFLSTDPAPHDDPTALIDTPTLAQSYTYATNNPLTLGDADGRIAEYFQKTPQNASNDSYAWGHATFLISMGMQDTEANLTAKLKRYLYGHWKLTTELGFSALSDYGYAKDRQRFAFGWEGVSLVQFVVTGNDRQLLLLAGPWGSAAEMRWKSHYTEQDQPGGAHESPVEIREDDDFAEFVYPSPDDVGSPPTPQSSSNQRVTPEVNAELDDLFAEIALNDVITSAQKGMRSGGDELRD